MSASRQVRGSSRFTQGDVARAIRAAKKENLPIAAVRIDPDGTILILPAGPGPVQPLLNPWDDE